VQKDRSVLLRFLVPGSAPGPSISPGGTRAGEGVGRRPGGPWAARAAVRGAGGLFSPVVAAAGTVLAAGGPAAARG